VNQVGAGFVGRITNYPHSVDHAYLFLSRRQCEGVGLRPTAVSEGVTAIVTLSFAMPAELRPCTSSESLVSGAESRDETGEFGSELTV
jgi:hypothetical protein